MDLYNKMYLHGVCFFSPSRDVSIRASGVEQDHHSGFDLEDHLPHHHAHSLKPTEEKNHFESYRMSWTGSIGSERTWLTGG